MAWDGMGIDISLNSSGDMSSFQYRCVVASTTNKNQGCILNVLKGTKITGVYQDNSTAAEFGKVRVLGISKIQAGSSSGSEVSGGILEGAKIMCSTVGQAIEAAGNSSEKGIGIALESMATDSTGIIAALIIPMLEGSTST